MTKPQLERILRTWQRRLKLEHWDIKIDWNNPADDGAIADNERMNKYDDSIIRLSRTWPSWDSTYAAATIVHELLHCHDRDLQEAMKALDGDKTWSAHELEGFVDRLAVILVGLAGPA